MQGILIIAHGSREKQTEETFLKMVSMIKEKVNMPVEYAYMEFSPKNIECGLNALVEQGINDIKVVPYFLFSGIHIREDIPQEINEFVEKNANVTITMGDTLGADPRIADVLADRILGK
ncbi:CbiX/SirB N-terminal domain-containing protein [Paludicola sp. MB14-C6]|uniref:sirohydrochlorin chelatase n=1 Tax=Paludihabitans sp. MB14-C6 TaxID=3070656 RepID=UPI0027DC7E3F|nr:CbiX/SirB N-terminal domain-containing protein [Paludicola sp. MB14-C6]WMJ22041.1 CbiX/SirB N-terminal domain-containing protein [Paludicola sp. MB14-C6]